MKRGGFFLLLFAWATTSDAQNRAMLPPGYQDFHYQLHELCRVEPCARQPFGSGVFQTEQDCKSAVAKLQPQTGTIDDGKRNYVCERREGAKTR